MPPQAKPKMAVPVQVGPLLTGNAAEVSEFTLNGSLDAAIRASNAQFDDADTLARLRVKMERAAAHETGVQTWCWSMLKPEQFCLGTYKPGQHPHVLWEVTARVVCLWASLPGLALTCLAWNVQGLAALFSNPTVVQQC